MWKYKSALCLALLSCTSASSATPWEKIKSPIAGQVQSIGGYSNGCIIGAQPLALKGEGYQVIRHARNRYYGHPNLLAYLQQLGKLAKQAGLPPILIGDMGMPAGGRFASGHASHQTGLDADIWLRFGPMDDKTAAKPDGLGLLVVDRERKVINANWQAQHAQLIKLAASAPQVDRIFVNPAIKVQLCATAGADRAWLRKIRPWHAHDSHFHVRLTCPKDAPQCENQAPIPSGDGCGAELASWFEPPKPSTTSQNKTLPQPPAQCRMILVENGLE